MALSQSIPSHDADPFPARTAGRAFAYAALGTLGVLALFLLTHPYGGILHDARLYVGYALAALHPDSIGQDMVLAEQGQSGFTVFPALLVFMVETFGSSLGAKLTALAGLILWFAGAAALAATIAQGRTRWVILVFLAVLPGYYGGRDVFSFAEALAVPRPFAEAFVLLALALLASGRIVAGVVPLLAAALFHPIMALPGFAVWGWLMVVTPHTRLVRPVIGIACCVVGVVVLIAAAALGVPPADRLFTVVDPTWREILKARTPYLFVSSWQLADWTRLIVQMATVAIAASVVTGRIRALFAAVAFVGAAGVLVSLVLGDWLQSLLILQAQPWRATWLVAVFAAAGLAMCSIALWRKGSVARVTLAVLVLAWIEIGVPIAAIVAAALALGLTFLPLRLEVDFRRVSMVIWVVVAFCAALTLGMHLYAFTLLVSNRPEGGVLETVRSLSVLAIPICLLAVLWANAWHDIRTAVGVAAISVALVVAVMLAWDDRTPWQVASDRFGPDPALESIVSARDGEVLWMGGGFATWSQAGRPNWVSRLQGASNVFSRPLALRWDTRARLLTELGMVDQRLRTPFSVKGRMSNEEPHLAKLSDAGLERLCGMPDAPAWLIAPAKIMESAQVSAERWKPSYWRAPSPQPSFAWDGQSVNWTATQSYVVIPCHG